MKKILPNLKENFVILAILGLFLALGGILVINKATSKEQIFVQKLPSKALLSLSPGNGEYLLGDIFEVKILLDSFGAKTDGVDAEIDFDRTKLLLEDAHLKPANLYPHTLLNTVDNIKGEIYFSAAAEPLKPYSGKGTLATIKFKAIGEGKAEVKFVFTPNVTTDSNVAEHATGKDILIGVENGTYEILGR